MTEAFALDIGREALYTVLLVSAPVLGLGLIVGLVVSIFQATTQIQEQTLSFVPKILVVFLVLMVFGPWMMSVLIDYTSRIFGSLNTVVR